MAIRSGCPARVVSCSPIAGGPNSTSSNTSSPHFRGCLDFHPWPVRAGDTDHPDELRLDFGPTPGFGFAEVKEAVAGAKELLDEVGLVGWPKTSGSRGIHVYIRIEPLWDFFQTRRAVLAFARELERRMDGLVTTAWWKEERRGIFIDYNQNAR